MNIAKSQAIGCNTTVFIKQFGKITFRKVVDVNLTFDVNYFFSISRIFVPPPRLQEADTNSQILLSLF